ncbi:MAG: glycoside hydrolase family 30 beta sandwich domain-containing protein [Bacilli bacterium]
MKIQIFSTSPKTFFQEMVPLLTMERPNVSIDFSKKHQFHIGFGGALTDSAAYVYAQLPRALKQEVLDALYGQNGLNYSLGRIPIASCDFSLESYDFISSVDQSDFSLQPIKQYLLPLVHSVLNYKKITLMASSWSPPAIYKSNHLRTHGGKLLRKYYQAYAEYLTRFLSDLIKENIRVTMLTIQNEPLATQVWESCIFTGPEELRLAKILRNCLDKAQLKHISLFGWDHNRDKMVTRARVLFKEDEIFAGIAYHWYDQGIHQAIAKVKQNYPNKVVLFTEGCVELLHYQHPKNAVGLYSHALRYARNYLKDILAGSQGFIDWNILLDSSGGPNHVGNFCEAPLMYDTDKQILIYNPSYFALKHFAHFIQVNAQRISVSTSSPNLELCAYQNPDNSLVLVVINNGNQEKIVIDFANQNMMCYIESDSITSIYITQ